jgi:hypothetical protein
MQNEQKRDLLLNKKASKDKKENKKLAWKNGTL